MKMTNRLAGRFIGDKAFYGEVARVAVPIILQQMIAVAMGFIDSVMVGQIDAQAMAGITVANKYFMILQSLLIAVSGGVCIFISQYYGADDHEKGQGLFDLGVITSLFLGGTFALLASLIPRTILQIFVAEPATISYGLEYLQYIRFSYLPFAATMTIVTAMRSVGSTRLPFIFGSISVVLNTVLNYGLIFGHFGLPAMGVAGAGLATLIARSLELVLLLAALARRKQYFKLSIGAIRELDKRILSAVIRKTIPLIGNELLWVLGIVLTFKAYCLVDEPNIASLTIVETVSNAAFLFFSGFAAAVAVLVGARLGAGRFDEARLNARRLLAIGLFTSLGISLLVLLSAAPIVDLFKVSDHIRSLALSMLRIHAGIYPVIILNVLFFLTLRTGGDIKAMLIMDAFFSWLITLPLAFGLALLVRPPLPVFYLAIQLTEIVKFFIASALFRRGHWLKNLT